MVGRSGAAIVDQALWAGTNFALTVVVARQLSPSSFGLFALAAGVVAVAAGLANVSSGESLSVMRGLILREATDGAGSAAEVRLLVQRSLAIVMVVALATPAVAGVVIVIFGAGVDSGPAWSVAAAGPIVVASEGVRAALYATRRMRPVLLMTAAWAVIQAVLMSALLAQGALRPQLAVLAWGVGSAGALVVGSRALGAWPRFQGAGPGEWARRARYSAEYVITTVPTFLMAVIAGLMLGLAGAGVVRALQTLFGPLNVLLTGLRNALLPAVAEVPSRARRAAAVTSGMGLVAVLVVTGVLAVWPAIGEAMLGPSWPRDTSILWGFSTGRCALALTLGALIMYRAYDLGWWSSRLRLASAAALLIPFSLGALASISVALWAAGGATLVVSGLWWWVALRNARQFANRPAKYHGLTGHRLSGD